MGTLSCCCTKLLLQAAMDMFATADLGAVAGVWKLTEHIWLFCCLAKVAHVSQAGGVSQ